MSAKKRTTATPTDPDADQTAPTDPAAQLLDLANACRDLADEMYHADKRQEWLDYQNVKERTATIGRLRRRVDEAATETLRWATASGLTLGDAEPRIDALRQGCYVVLWWGWEHRGLAPPPALPALEDDPNSEDDAASFEQYLKARSELTREQVESEREWPTLIEQFTAAAAAVVRLRIVGLQKTRSRGEARINIVGQTVRLDGDPVPLNMTAEKRKAAVCLLQHLLTAAGDWRSGPELDDMENAGPCRCHAGDRWDRIRKTLPEPLLSLTETDRRKGTRLRADAWRILA